MEKSLRLKDRAMKILIFSSSVFFYFNIKYYTEDKSKKALLVTSKLKEYVFYRLKTYVANY